MSEQKNGKNKRPHNVELQGADIGSIVHMPSPSTKKQEKVN